MSAQSKAIDLPTTTANRMSGWQHVEIIKSYMSPDGLLEIRALRRLRDEATVEETIKFAGARFIPRGAAEKEFISALEWAAALAEKGVEVFIGYNARTRRSGKKEDVKLLTACYADLDLHGADVSLALAGARAARIRPEMIVDSGYGLHLSWFIEPTSDKNQWLAVQRSIESHFADLGADSSVTTDESRVLRLVPFPNLKYGKSRPTSIVELCTPPQRLTITDLARAFTSNQRTAMNEVDLVSIDIDKSIPSGRRNTTLSSLAGSMRRRGISPGAIEAALLVENELRCKPPLAADEVRQIATSIGRYEPATNKQSAAAYRNEVAAERPLRFYTAREIAAQVPKDVSWIARPWIARGAITEMDGKIKVAGKTTFLLHLCRCVVEGLPFMGEPTMKTRVVYLTEESKTTFRAALRRASLLESDDFVALFWHEIHGKPWCQVVEAAVEECNRRRADLLVVDTLGQFASIQGDGENNAGEALAAVQPLQLAVGRDGLAVAFTRHERKSGGEVGDSGRGSSATAGAVDTVLSIRRGDGHSAPNMRVIHALSRFDEPRSLLVVELTDHGYVSHGSDSHIAVNNAKEAILNVAPKIEAEAQTLEDLMRTAGTRRTVTQEAVKALVEKGDLKQIGKGKRGSALRFWQPAKDDAAPTEINSAATSIPNSGRKKS